MKFIKRFLAMLLCIAILGIGVSLTIKATIGIGPYDAVSQSFASIFGIKVGTVTMIINTLFVLAQIIIKRKDFKMEQFLQFLIIFAFGIIVNYFLYNIFTFELYSYFIQLIIFLIGILVTAFGVAGVMNINVVYTPLEGFLSVLSEVSNITFIKFRMGFDIFSIILTFILAFSFNIPLAVREGTILSAIIFSPIMGWMMKIQSPILKKLDLLIPADSEKIQDKMDII